MAIDNTVALWNENAGAVYNAREYRRMMEKLMGFDVVTTPGTGSGGVFRTADCLVSAGGGQSVNVAAGAVFVDGSESATQGGYFVYNDATVNVVLTAANATNPRKDLIGVQIRDSEYSGVTNDARILVITGTPAASPVDPTPPADFVTLALVDVPANDNVVDAGQITDRRRQMAAKGGIAVCTSTTRPSVNLFEGLWVYETDTHALKQYTTGTTLWTPPWNVSWGQYAYAQVTANQATLGVGPTNLTGLTTGAITYVANRRVRLSGHWVQAATGGGGEGFGSIREGGTTLKQDIRSFGSGSDRHGQIPSLVLSPTAAAHTYVMSGGKNAFDSDLNASATNPAYILSEDMGPNGAPS